MLDIQPTLSTKIGQAPAAVQAATEAGCSGISPHPFVEGAPEVACTLTSSRQGSGGWRVRRWKSPPQAPGLETGPTHVLVSRTVRVGGRDHVRSARTKRQGGMMGGVRMPRQGLEPKTATDSHYHAKTTTSRSASFVPAGIPAPSPQRQCSTSNRPFLRGLAKRPPQCRQRPKRAVRRLAPTHLNSPPRALPHFETRESEALRPGGARRRMASTRPAGAG
jgi:hypothetical protein